MSDSNAYTEPAPPAVTVKEPIQMGGTNPAYLLEEQGNFYYGKEYKDKDQARCEWVSNQIYAEMGAPVLEGRLMEVKGRLFYATPLVKFAYSHYNLSYNTEQRVYEVSDTKYNYKSGPNYYHIQQLNTLYIPAALLMDWDVVGVGDKPLGNILVEDEQHIIHVDHGGSILFHGLMGKKPEGALSANVSELDIFLDDHGINPITAAVFRHMTPAARRDGAIQLAQRLTPEKIASIVGRAGFDTETQRNITDLLTARRQTIIDTVLGKLYFPDESVPVFQEMNVTQLPAAGSITKAEILADIPMTIESFCQRYNVTAEELPDEFNKLIRNIVDITKGDLNASRNFHYETALLYRIWRMTRDKNFIEKEYPTLKPIADALDDDESFASYVSSLGYPFTSEQEHVLYEMIEVNILKNMNAHSRYTRSGTPSIVTTTPDAHWIQLPSAKFGFSYHIVDEQILRLATTYLGNPELRKMILHKDDEMHPENNLLIHDTNLGILDSLGELGELASAQRLIQVHKVRMVSGENVSVRESGLGDVYASRGEISGGNSLLTWFDRQAISVVIPEKQQEETMREHLKTEGLTEQEIDGTINRLLRRGRALDPFIGAGPRNYDNLLGPFVPLKNISAIFVPYERLDTTKQWAEKHAPHMQIYSLEASKLITEYKEYPDFLIALLSEYEAMTRESPPPTPSPTPTKG